MMVAGECPDLYPRSGAAEDDSNTEYPPRTIVLGGRDFRLKGAQDAEFPVGKPATLARGYG